MASSRRKFLASVSGAFAMVGGSSHFPGAMVRAAENSAASRNASADRILVVIQLSGGNDGLNTVVPFADDAYYENRFALAIGREAVLKVNDSLGLHPSMEGMAKLLENAQLSIVNGVGYPSPNRSHFKSMDLWHTAHRAKKQVPVGWLGQWIDESAGELNGLHLGGGELPLALRAENIQVPSVSSIDEFRLRVRGSDRRRHLIADLVDASAQASEIKGTQDHTGAASGELARFLSSAAQAALKTSDRMEQISESGRLTVRFPGSGLGQKLASVARMIRAELPTRVYYVTLDGFDTHSNQRDAHAGLLTQLSAATTAFVEEMKAMGVGERVLVFAFSEFGRRLKENASQGTDHGAAAPVFLAGDAVKAGAIGAYPSLTDLDDGDLKFKIDYRSVYTTLIDQWLGGDAKSLLNAQFKAVDCLDV